MTLPKHSPITAAMTGRHPYPPWPWVVLYELALLMVLPYALLHLLSKARHDRRYLHHLKERLGGSPATLPRRAIWFHTVSVGELHAAAPLIEDCLALPHSVLVTGQTPAVRERVQDLWQGKVAFSYLPYDRQPWVRRFLDTLQPRLAVFVERELWPNWFCQCAAKGIPLLLINARLSPTALTHYRPIRPLVATALQAAARIAARSKDDALLLQQLGCPRVETLGDLKQASWVMRSATGNQGMLLAGGRPFWVAGSTHEGEEETILAAHRELRHTCPQALLILAPRHVERASRLRVLIRRLGLQAQYLGELRQHNLAAETNVLLLDRLGVLASCYTGALAAFVGGTLAPIGGHTPFEAASSGCPVLIGPHRHHIAAAAEALFERGAARMVTSDTLGSILSELACNPALRAVMGQAAQETACDDDILSRYRELLASCMLESQKNL